MSIIAHGFGGKKATPVSHGYGSQTAGLPPIYREIWNDMPITDGIYRPMAINCGTEKFNGGS